MKQSILGSLPPEQFLKSHWQKKPLLIRQAIPGFHSPISADELAGLALEQQVESRMVLEHGNSPWELRHGPFTEQNFSSLPESHWTLLVQAVDHWVPDIRQLLDHFSFLPSWRLDDIMVSYACDGGSVGPHYDQYDVFLLQAQGKRRWQVGPIYDASSPKLENTNLHILADFKAEEEYLLEPGDMLYLPPGVGHHGVAEGECMTISIGFRAPSHKDILMHFTDFLADQLPDHLRYADPDQQPTVNRGEIDDNAIDRLQGILAQYLQDRDLLGQWFGAMMTTSKYEQEADEEDWSWSYLQDEYQDCQLIASDSSRLAFRWEERWSESHFCFFADGEGEFCRSAETRELAMKLCQTSSLAPDGWQALKEEESRLLLLRLLNKGTLYPA